MDYEGHVRAASVLSLLAGLWLFVSPYVLGFSTYYYDFASWTVHAVAIAVIILSAIRLLWPHGTEGISWVNAVIGLWLILSPFVWFLTGNFILMIDFIIVGALIVLFNVWGAMAHRAAARF